MAATSSTAFFNAIRCVIKEKERLLIYKHKLLIYLLKQKNIKGSE
jgi:hypothetical protein